MSFSVFEKIDPSCQNGSMEKAKNIPYHQRPYASIAERTLVDISIYSPRPQIAGTGHSHSKISIHSPRAGRDCRYPNAPLITQISIHSPRMGRDTHFPIFRIKIGYFNPLSPHGERRYRLYIGYLEFAPQPSPNQAIADNRSIEQRICIKPAKRSRQRDLSLLVRFMQRRATPITQKDVSRR